MVEKLGHTASPYLEANMNSTDDAETVRQRLHAA